jgi:type I restriction enzyme S subunit
MSKVAHTPQLRFPEFSGDWEEKKLSDISDVRDGTHESPKYVLDGFPLITSKNLLSNGSIDFENINLVSEEDYTNINKRSKVDINDILFGMIGTIGNPVIVKETGFAIKNVALIKQQKELLNKFMIFYLSGNSIAKQFYIENTGGTQKFLALGVIRSLKIKFPPDTEQQKIAAFLTAVDNKIEQLSKKQELLGEYKKGLMQQIFSQAIRFKADDGSTFPEWKEKKLGDIVRFENGKGHEQNISKDGKFIVVNSKFISSQGRVKKYTDTQKSPLNFGDVVMVMSDVPNGKALAKCYYIEQDNLYSLNQRICGLKHKLADTKFIYYRINRHKYFLSFDSGVGQTNLKKMEILNCPLNIPTDIKEQAKIANFLSSVDNKIEQMGKQLDESKQFKKALLQQMFV